MSDDFQDIYFIFEEFDKSNTSTLDALKILVESLCVVLCKTSAREDLDHNVKIAQIAIKEGVKFWWDSAMKLADKDDEFNRILKEWGVYDKNRVKEAE